MGSGEEAAAGLKSAAAVAACCARDAESGQAGLRGWLLLGPKAEPLLELFLVLGRLKRKRGCSGGCCTGGAAAEEVRVHAAGQDRGAGICAEGELLREEQGRRRLSAAVAAV